METAKSKVTTATAFDAAEVIVKAGSAISASPDSVEYLANPLVSSSSISIRGTVEQTISRNYPRAAYFECS